MKKLSFLLAALMLVTSGATSFVNADPDLIPLDPVFMSLVLK